MAEQGAFEAIEQERQRCTRIVANAMDAAAGSIGARLRPVWLCIHNGPHTPAVKPPHIARAAEKRRCLDIVDSFLVHTVDADPAAPHLHALRTKINSDK